MRRMLGVVLGIFVLIFAYIIGWPIFKFLVLTPKGAFSMAQTVSTVRARVTPWQRQLQSVGTLHAVEGADLAAEVSGIVTRTPFHPGDDIRRGALLIQLRDDSDRAQLAALQAAAALAAQTYERDAALNKTNAISKLEYDTALANMKNARAQADAQAAVVDKKAIRAPFSGRVGIRQVDVGQFVTAGQTLVTLQELDPIDVDFLVPQQNLAILSPGDQVSLTTNAVPGVTFHGKIMALDPKVDPTTRNVRVRAEIANPQKKLYPGMFATVITKVGGEKSFITLPQTAVVYNPYGDTVFLVVKHKAKDGSDELVAEQRFITVGETRGDQVAVLSGLTTKDVVVSAGQIKLKNGTPVTVNNSVKLPDSATPNPVEQ
ncbi:MAG: efflux RND transporter periplasmic adaptor subunit [Alphaproteobacteria bacterium]|nr:efflux RND transporter periplasmic adaptor subunit [Alphaproteobacteria bacterium]